MAETKEISREKVANCPSCPLGDDKNGGLVKVTFETTRSWDEIQEMRKKGEGSPMPVTKREQYRCGIENSDTAKCSLVYVANLADRAFNLAIRSGSSGPTVYGGP